MTPLTIGIIGCGRIAAEKHLPTLLALPDLCRVTALCSPHKEKAFALAEQYRLDEVTVYAEAEALLRNPSIDVVYILTPNAQHAPLAMAAVKAGKHVLVEKPMAVCVQEAQALAEVAAASGKKVTVSYQHRFRKEAQSLYHRRQELGQIYAAKAYATRKNGVPNWGTFTDPAQQGGGALLDIGSHALDLTLWVMDNWEPESVFCQTFSKLHKLEGMEESAFAMLRMKNGAVVSLEAAWDLNTEEPRPCAAEFYGTQGGATLGCNRQHSNTACDQPFAPPVRSRRVPGGSTRLAALDPVGYTAACYGKASSRRNTHYQRHVSFCRNRRKRVSVSIWETI